MDLMMLRERVKVIRLHVKLRNTDAANQGPARKTPIRGSQWHLELVLVGHGEWKRNGLQHRAEVSIAVKESARAEDYLGRC